MRSARHDNPRKFGPIFTSGNKSGKSRNSKRFRETPSMFLIAAESGTNSKSSLLSQAIYMLLKALEKKSSCRTDWYRSSVQREASNMYFSSSKVVSGGKVERERAIPLSMCFSQKQVEVPKLGNLVQSDLPNKRRISYLIQTDPRVAETSCLRRCLASKRRTKRKRPYKWMESTAACTGVAWTLPNPVKFIAWKESSSAKTR